MKNGHCGRCSTNVLLQTYGLDPNREALPANILRGVVSRLGVALMQIDSRSAINKIVTDFTQLCTVMPYTRRKRYVKKRRTYKRRRATARTPSGFPAQQVFTLKYTDTFQLSNTSGVLSEYKYRANSVFDPQYSVGGHQPFGFDQRAQFYNHYQVISSKISLRAMPPVSHTLNNMVVGAYISDDATAYTDWTTYLEAGRGSHALMSSVNTETTRTFGSSFSKKTFFGPVVDNGDTSATVTANPTEGAFFHIWQQPADKVATVGEITYIVNISYRVRFFEPKDIVAS